MAIAFQVITANGQDWTYFKGEYGIHKTITVAQGKMPDGNALTTLTLACKGDGPKGNILLSYGVREAAKLSSFDFEYFHGPGAGALGKRLVSLTVETPRGTERVRLKVSGSYSDMDNQADFQFELGPPPPHFIHALMSGAQKVTIRVTDDRKKRNTIYSTFPADGAASALKELLKQCGK